MNCATWIYNLTQQTTSLHGRIALCGSWVFLSHRPSPMVQANWKLSHKQALIFLQQYLLLCGKSRCFSSLTNVNTLYLCACLDPHTTVLNSWLSNETAELLMFCSAPYKWMLGVYMLCLSSVIWYSLIDICGMSIKYDCLSKTIDFSLTCKWPRRSLHQSLWKRTSARHRHKVSSTQDHGDWLMQSRGNEDRAEHAAHEAQQRLRQQAQEYSLPLPSNAWDMDPDLLQDGGLVDVSKTGQFPAFDLDTILNYSLQPCHAFPVWWCSVLVADWQLF